MGGHARVDTPKAPAGSEVGVHVTTVKALRPLA